MQRPTLPPLSADRVTRRHAISSTFFGSLLAAAGFHAATERSIAREPVADSSKDAPQKEFIPENDYPFFGGEVPAGYESPTTT